ncbi:hypothetical protein Ct9H90mP29_15850 [bacterium]|nr:MAG: hypothetical protein Ct9H90mP29_15850 [bacterium]
MMMSHISLQIIFLSILIIVIKQWDQMVIISEGENTLASADTMIQTFTRDFYAFEPISDEVFNVYNGMFQYDPFKF